MQADSRDGDWWQGRLDMISLIRFCFPDSITGVLQVFWIQLLGFSFQILCPIFIRHLNTLCSVRYIKNEHLQQMFSLFLNPEAAFQDMHAPSLPELCSIFEARVQQCKPRGNVTLQGQILYEHF